MTNDIAFESLPLRKNGPPGNAWGRFGENDELGTLNWLTPENTKRAAEEIQDGTRVSTDWPLGSMATPCFGRRPIEHKLKNLAPHICNDDELHINTQSSSQWDGFRHFGYQKEKLFYGGVKQEEIERSAVIGTNAWVENGGIVGRGVLLDYAAYCDDNNLKPEIFSPTSITAAEIQKVAEAQNTTFRKGDILFIRVGWIRGYNALSTSERQTLAETNPPPGIGLASSEETLRWLWSNEFAAVVGDHPTVEAWPVQEQKYCLHEWLLAGWGCPLGEMFDLERLSKVCKEKGRYTFFFSSVPLKVPGGVASPPNGVAIF